MDGVLTSLTNSEKFNIIYQLPSKSMRREAATHDFEFIQAEDRKHPLQKNIQTIKSEQYET